jgi:hypothetical protein
MPEETPRNEPQIPAKTGIDLQSLHDLALGPRWSSGPVLENTPRLNFREEKEYDRGSRPERSGAPRRDRRQRFDHGDKRPAQEGEGGGENRPQRFQRRDREYSRPSAPPPPFRPVVQVALYPQDEPFKLLGTAIKNSCRTYELFEIARLILEKPERFVVVVHPIEGAAPSALFISQPDNMPFESEEAALAHVFTCNLSSFFDIQEVEVEPPKGNFQIVNKCGITGELLAPPNYHKYQQILQAHYTAHCSNIPYERFLSHIEGLRDKESIDKWVEKMKKQTRYKLKEPIEGAPAEFDTLDSARFILIMHAKEKLVRVVQTARFDGAIVDKMPEGLIRKSIETVIDEQRRFPLDTANNLRGRLRRMSFSVYKKGSKGISYVCAIRRNFRKVGETFSETIQQLVEFIEAHPGFPASDLPKEYLGTQIPAEGEATMAPQDLERLKQLRTDMRWLITSGYVTEYSNGKLFAPPPQTNPATAAEEEVAPADVAAAASAATVAEVVPAEVPADAAVGTDAAVSLEDALKTSEASSTAVPPAAEPAPVKEPEAKVENPAVQETKAEASVQPEVKAEVPVQPETKPDVQPVPEAPAPEDKQV